MDTAQIAENILKENMVIEPPVPISTIVTNYGWQIQETDLPIDVSGFLKPKEKIIYINSKDSPARKAFTLAHLLAQIILHDAEIRKRPELSILHRSPLGAEPIHEIKKQANELGTELLVPRKMLEQVLKKYKELATPKRLADIFGVSEEVINYRLLSQNLINSE